MRRPWSFICHHLDDHWLVRIGSVKILDDDTLEASHVCGTRLERVAVNRTCEIIYRHFWVRPQASSFARGERKTRAAETYVEYLQQVHRKHAKTAFS